MMSYPPTLDELRASFIAKHPGCRFVNVGGMLYCPVEPVTTDQHGRYTGPNEKGQRYGEWLNYLIEQGALLAKEAGIVSLPVRAPMTMEPYRRLRVEEWYYSTLCMDPQFAPAAHLERRDSDRTFQQDIVHTPRGVDYLYDSYRRMQYRSGKIAMIAERTAMTPVEAEAVLARLYPTIGYKKDTLLALKALNAYAATHGIRVEDAITVITEYSV